MRPLREKGAAVITAMLVVALAAATASFMMWQNQLWLRQVENLKDQAQGRWIARAAIDWGRAVLEDDSRDVDHEGERWATPIPPLEAEGGTVTGTLRDAQGLINLNDLVRNGKASQGDVLTVRRLFSELKLNPDLVNAMVDWMDADSEVRSPGGAEDMQYLALDPPYRAANRPLVDVDELYRVQGFNRDIVERLRPFVTVLPVPTPVNVNTASGEVLAALCGVSEDAGRALVERRGSGFFKDKAEFRKLLPADTALREEDYSVNSQFFMAATRARFGRVAAGYRALVERPASGRTKILWLKQSEE